MHFGIEINIVNESDNHVDDHVFMVVLNGNLFDVTDTGWYKGDNANSIVLLLIDFTEFTYKLLFIFLAHQVCDVYLFFFHSDLYYCLPSLSCVADKH